MKYQAHALLNIICSFKYQYSIFNLINVPQWIGYYKISYFYNLFVHLLHSAAGPPATGIPCVAKISLYSLFRTEFIIINIMAFPSVVDNNGHPLLAHLPYYNNIKLTSWLINHQGKLKRGLWLWHPPTTATHGTITGWATACITAVPADPPTTTATTHTSHNKSRWQYPISPVTDLLRSDQTISRASSHSLKWQTIAKLS